jgi:hypothetical protein
VMSGPSVASVTVVLCGSTILFLPQPSASCTSQLCASCLCPARSCMSSHQQYPWQLLNCYMHLYSSLAIIFQTLSGYLLASGLCLY